MTIDTLQLTNRLIEAGIEREKAEAVVKTIVQSQEDLATREQMGSALIRRLAPLRTDLAVLK